jgi:hypothetical protein
MKLSRPSALTMCVFLSQVCDIAMFRYWWIKIKRVVCMLTGAVQGCENIFIFSFSVFQYPLSPRSTNQWRHATRWRFPDTARCYEYIRAHRESLRGGKSAASFPPQLSVWIKLQSSGAGGSTPSLKSFTLHDCTKFKFEDVKRIRTPLKTRA